MSVVICAYTDQRWDDICVAVASVLNQSVRPAEVLLVVDYCRPLLERARTAFPEITVLENTGKKGLSGARNVGYLHAGGQVVAFLDDDARADTEWVRRLTAGYLDDDVQGVGGTVSPAWVNGRPRWFPPEFDWVVGCSHSGMPTRLTEVRNFVGANMSLRRKALNELGGFSSELGRIGADVAGCEETELCIRAGRLTAKSRLVYDPQASVTHTVPADRATVGYFLRRCVGEGKSKATVRGLVGASDGLASERTYLHDTIPVGIRRGCRDAIRGDLAGLLRVAALIAGVGATMAGYARTLIRPKRSPVGQG